MIILGILLLIIGFVAGIAIVWSIGAIVFVIGLVLWILGALGHAVGGRRSNESCATIHGAPTTIAPIKGDRREHPSGADTRVECPASQL